MVGSALRDVVGGAEALPGMPFPCQRDEGRVSESGPQVTQDGRSESGVSPCVALGLAEQLVWKFSVRRGESFKERAHKLLCAVRLAPPLHPHRHTRSHVCAFALTVPMRRESSPPQATLLWGRRWRAPHLLHSCSHPTSLFAHVDGSVGWQVPSCLLVTLELHSRHLEVHGMQHQVPSHPF